MTVAVDSGDYWPADADDVDEAVVANWFVREGGRVDAGDTLCEIQIEKVSVDVTASESGTLAERVVPENGEFRRGDVLARIDPE
jgi:pyruvate/2-oxoglutarate dehydrogenase complex dihydrolipoamide acyltransferase (E2) component